MNCRSGLREPQTMTGTSASHHARASLQRRHPGAWLAPRDVHERGLKPVSASSNAFLLTLPLVPAHLALVHPKGTERTGAPYARTVTSVSEAGVSALRGASMVRPSVRNVLIPILTPQNRSTRTSAPSESRRQAKRLASTHMPTRLGTNKRNEQVR